MSDLTALSLDKVLDFLQRHNINDERIYEFLTNPADENSIAKWTNRIERIDGAKKPAGITPRTWVGKKNKLRGACFEKLTGFVLQTVKPFTSWNRVHTAINEIDWLVQIGPTAHFLPVMRNWGSYCVCECKFGVQAVSVSWVGKLNTTLQTHGASVGLLVSSKGLSRKGRGSAVRTQLQVLAAMTPSRVILCLNIGEIRSSLSQRRFLQLITGRFIEAKTGAAALQTLI
jgi:hypothetical protein